MTSLFDVGRSALNSYRQSLAVTGQNIANINTEGYKRREASLEEVVGSQGGVTTLANQTGLGVRVSEIKRSFDQYLLDRSRTATAQFEKLDVYVDQTEQLENMLLPNEGDLGSQIAKFFDSLREVAASPADIAPRAVAIEQGKSLAAGFNTYAMQLDRLKSDIQNNLDDTVSSLNILATSLADINSRILSSGQSGSSPNAILDLRDQTLTEISKLTDITVSYSGRGVAQVKLGTSGVGPSLVDNAEAFDIGISQTSVGLQPTIMSGGKPVGTNQIQAGMTAGLIDAYNTADNALSDINHLAQMMSVEMNAQHKRGTTLDGQPGLNMFSVADLTVSTGTANRSDVAGTLMVSDPEAIPLSKMTATYSAEEELWILTGEALTSPIRGATQITAPGFTLQINGAPAAGDVLLLDPLAGAAQGMRFLLDKPQQIAASSGLLVSSHPDNLSEAEMDIDMITPAEDVKLKQVDQIFKNSASPIEASAFIRDGFVAEIPAGTSEISLASLTQQSTAKFQLSSLEISKVSSLSFALEDTSPAGPFTFDVRYNTAFPNAASTAAWSDMAELADMLNRGVLTDSAGLTLKDRGLHASGANGSLTLSTSRGNFDDSDANIATLNLGGGVTRAIVRDAVDASDIQIFTKEGRHIAGNVLSNDEIANLMRSENGFRTDAEYRGDYLNQTDPAYRGMNIDVQRSQGMHELNLGANATTATAIGSRGKLPVSTVPAQAVTVRLGSGPSSVVNLEQGGSAADAAEALNKGLKNLGVHAEARLRVELSDLEADGNVTFQLESQNASPITISAQVAENDLTNLATAINDQSARLGITAYLSTNKQRVIMESADGRDIFISDYMQGSPTLTSKVVDDEGQAASAELDLGTEGASYDHARYSGVVSLKSVKDFTLTKADDTVYNSVADVTEGGLVSVQSNASADSKLVSFTVNETADKGDASDDGLMAVAAGGNYSLSLPTSDDDVTFTAEVSTAELSDITSASVNKAIVDKLREAGPLSSMSAGDEASKPASQTFRYSGTNTIDPANDTLTVTVENTLITVPLAGVTTSQQMMDAAATAINAAGLDVVATAIADTSSVPNTFDLKIEASERGASFDMGAVSFTDADDPAATLAYQSSVVAKNMPVNGDFVYVDFAGQSYKLEMVDDEIVVSGGEEGRLTAYFDANKRLQIFGGGSLSGQPITVSSSEKFASNDVNAATFGLVDNIMRFTGQAIAPSATLEDLTLSFDGTEIDVSLDGMGVLTTSPSALPSGLTIEFDQETGAATGRLIITYDPAAHELKFDMPQDKLGVKTADIDLSYSTAGIRATSRSGDVLEVNATASSLADQQITVSDLVVEDLLVFVTGNGAKMMNSQYQVADEASRQQLESRLSESGLIVESISEDGTHFEILDGETGHSIASRTIDEDRHIRFENYQFTIKGNAVRDDQFLVEDIDGAAGDSRNLEAMIKKQTEDLNGVSSGGFSDMFSTMIAGVGASVSSSQLARDGAEATKEAALEAEAEFSGVNLDSEAAALIEFQQAYQASARILSTARELFQTLIDVV